MGPSTRTGDIKYVDITIFRIPHIFRNWILATSDGKLLHTTIQIYWLSSYKLLATTSPSTIIFQATLSSMHACSAYYLYWSTIEVYNSWTSYIFVCIIFAFCPGLLRPGFMYALRCVLKLKVRGLLMAGPPCGSFVWVNRSTSGRSRTRIFGNCARQYVKDANAYFGYQVNKVLMFVFVLVHCFHYLMPKQVSTRVHPQLILSPRITCRFIILAMIAIARLCELIGEQPGSSLMPDFPYLKFMAVAIDPIPWGRIRLFRA